MKLWFPIVAVVILGVVSTGITLMSKQGRDLLPLAKLAADINASVVLRPQANTVNVGQEITYEVQVTTTNLHVVGVESYFNYDPKVVEIISTEPGSLMSEPQILKQQINKEQGKISYALGTLDPNQSAGVALTIRARVLTITTQPLITIDKNMTKIALRDPAQARPLTKAETNASFMEEPVTVLP